MQQDENKEVKAEAVIPTKKSKKSATFASQDAERKRRKSSKIDKPEQKDVSMEKPKITTDIDEVPKFIKMFWYNYKTAMTTFNWALLILCLVIFIFFLLLSLFGEEPYINRSEAIAMRNFSVLVPIWGPLGQFSLGHWTFGFSLVMLAMGIMYGALGVLGMCAFRSACFQTEEKEFRRHTYYILFNVLSLVIFLTTMTAALYGDSSIHKDAKTKLLSTLIKEYQIMEENAFTIAMNILMITGDCCGINGPEDFSENELVVTVDKNQNPYKFHPKDLYWPPDRESLTLKIPPACCKREIFQVGSLEEQYKNMKECTLMSYSTVKANVIGCGQAFLDNFVNQYGDTALVFLILFILLQLYVTGICIIRTLQHLDCTDEYEYADEHDGEVTHSEKKPQDSTKPRKRK